MNTTTVAQALAAPFAANEIRWKPQTVSGNRALAICYIDARAVIDRLDEVLGVDGWSDSYHQLSDGSTVCTLRVKIGDTWIAKQDVGSPSEQPDEGDRHKAAFSDALKRAAVKLGIGRYLYRLPKQWADWDSQKKQFARTPSLPASALPTAKPMAAAVAPSKNGTAKPNGTPKPLPTIRRSNCPF